MGWTTYQLVQDFIHQQHHANHELHLPKTHMTMESQPFKDVSPIKTCWICHCHVSLLEIHVAWWNLINISFPSSLVFHWFTSLKKLLSKSNNINLWHTYISGQITIIPKPEFELRSFSVGFHSCFITISGDQPAVATSWATPSSSMKNQQYTSPPVCLCT